MAISTYTPFNTPQATPVLSPTGSETLTAFGSALKVGSTFYYYYMYAIGGLHNIGRATSSDGLTWAKDTANNPVFSPSSSGNWDDAAVGVPTVWKEGSTWYMLYRGVWSGDSKGRGGLATSSDGISWTRVSGNKASGQTGNGCVFDLGLVSGGTESIEPYGIIKVGSTYYLSIDQPGGVTRSTGIATSTDLVNWTKDPSNPLYTGGRYCTAIIRIGSWYYQFVSNYLGGTTTYSQIEVYRNATPVFYPSTRLLMGSVRMPTGDTGPNDGTNWESFGLDTPFILTDDVFRNSFDATGGDLFMYYSGSSNAQHANFYTGLSIAFAGPSFVQPQPAGFFPHGAVCQGPVTVTADVKCGGTNGFWLTNPSGFFFWAGRSQISSPSNGNILVQNTAATDFGIVQLGGTSSSFPGLKRDGAGMRARLADDSADTWLKIYRGTVASLPSASTAGAGAFAVVTDASSPTIGAAVSGSGSTQCFVISNGSNWLAA